MYCAINLHGDNILPYVPMFNSKTNLTSQYKELAN